MQQNVPQEITEHQLEQELPAEDKKEANELELEKRLEDKVQELQEKEIQLLKRQLEFDTIKQLEQCNIPINVLPLILGANDEETQQNISVFKTEFDKAVQIEITKIISGKTPSNGSNKARDSDSGISKNKSLIREIMCGGK